MNSGLSDFTDESVEGILRGYFARVAATVRVPPNSLMMEKVHNARGAHARVRFRASRFVIAVAIVALVGTGSALAVTQPNPLGALADFIGVHEDAPATPAPNYAPAAVPYISVQPLMRYSGSAVPIVPAKAVVSRGGSTFVFVVAERVVHYRTSNSYAKLTVRKQQVEVGKRIGNVLTIESGLTACATVVVSPPATLEDRDAITSYHEQTAEGPAIDYVRLFGKRPPAPTPEIEGGLAGEANGLIRLAIIYHGDAPKSKLNGALYRVHLADGSIKEAPFDIMRRFVDVLVPRSSLVRDQPAAQVELADRSGATLAEGNLEPVCIE